MRRRDFLKTASIVTGAGVFGGISAPALAKKPITLKFDSYIAATAGPSRLDEWYLSELEKRTDGAVKVRRYWAQSLNKVGEHLGAVRDNTSEMSLISPGYYQADLPVTRGLEWYFRMQRADSLQLVCRDVYEQFQPLRDEWEKRHRSKVLYWTNWYYAPLVTRTPITSLDDIKGKRIRGYGVATDVIERLGGTAIPMAAPEVYTALERGVLDGVYGFDFITAVAYKLQEIAPHFTNIGDGPHGPSTTIMNIDTWNSLPDEVKKVSDQIVDEIYAGKYTEIYTAAAKEYVGIAKQGGVKFNTLSEAEQKRARETVQPAQVNAWRDTVAKPAGIDGQKMQRLIDAAIQKYDGAGKLLRPSEIAAS